MNDLTFNNRHPTCRLYSSKNTCSSSGSFLTKNKVRSTVFLLVSVAALTSSPSIITSGGDSLYVFPQERLPDGDCAAGNLSWHESEEKDPFDRDANLHFLSWNIYHRENLGEGVKSGCSLLGFAIVWLCMLTLTLRRKILQPSAWMYQMNPSWRVRLNSALSGN